MNKSLPLGVLLAGSLTLFGAQAIGVLPDGDASGGQLVKIAHDGTALPRDAALGMGADAWACTYDRQADLMWEVKAADGLRAASHRYVWRHAAGGPHDTTDSVEDGHCQSPGSCDTVTFVAAVNASNLCGHNDWRLPSASELYRLSEQAAAGSGGRSDSSAITRWSGFGTDRWADYARHAFYVDTAQYWYDPNRAYPVRLVRGGR
jgi:hypothetical protein